LRFAVHWPGIPEASPRSHGVPRRDILSRVHVGVASVSAGGALEDGLALTRLPVHLPARRAALARERRSDLLHPAGCLLLQAADQPTPPGPQDAPVQAGLLPDASVWVFPRTLRGPGHFRDLEVFNPDHVESPRDAGTGLLRPVLAPVRLAGTQAGDGELHPGTVIRPTPGPGQLAFQAPQPPLLPRRQAGCEQQFTGRQGCGDGHAYVDPDDLAGARCRDRMRNGREGDMPASRPVHVHSVGLRLRWYRAGPAEPYPPGLRHPDLAGFPAESPHVPLPPEPPHDPEPLVSPGLAPRRPSGRVARVEERGHRLSEVSQCLLLHRLRARGQPRILRPGLGELPALLQIPWGAVPARAPMRLLLNRQVPHIPGVRAVTPQHCLLGGRREQPVTGHANILANATVISGEVKRRFLPCLKIRAWSP
jgi:hypothetical protein